MEVYSATKESKHLLSAVIKTILWVVFSALAVYIAALQFFLLYSPTSQFFIAQGVFAGGRQTPGQHVVYQDSVPDWVERFRIAVGMETSPLDSGTVLAGPYSHVEPCGDSICSTNEVGEKFSVPTRVAVDVSETKNESLIDRGDHTVLVPTDQILGIEVGH